MKQVILSIFLSIVTLTGSAQLPDKNTDRYRQYAGRYGGNSGICLFEDGSFMLYGYATAVFGHYNFEKDHLLFYPDKPEWFEVYAHYNKNLGDSTRINFNGFEDGKTYVQLDNEEKQRVFNDDANCFDAPFVYQAAHQLTRFTLSFIRENVWWDLGKSNPSWQYEPAKNYNDFIWIFNEPKQEYEDFGAQLITIKGKTVLRLSNYGGEEGFIKQIPDEDEQKQWREILEGKRQYDASKRTTINTVFANKHYCLFPPPDSSSYIWNEATNEYISRQANDNEAYFRDNQYKDDRFLRKYIKLVAPFKDTANFTEETGADSSIFYTVCGASERPSYHYQGFVAYEEEATESTPLIATAPAPLPEPHPNKVDDLSYLPDSTKNNPADEIVTLIKPFAVNRADGFYTIEKKNAHDYTQTVLAAAPSITPKDFDTVLYKTGTNNKPVVEIRFNKTGVVKLEQFSTKNTGKQMALVADRKVIVMLFVPGPVKGDRIHISGNYSVEEAKNIATRLQQNKQRQRE